MGNIVILDEYTSNRIAAGEVIERPASVVKELVENSIDAGSSSVSVEIRNGGITYIKVTDNGSGIEKDDAEIAFERHATSKIKRPDDLDSISTLGFRGEALASIAAVAKVQLTTRVEKNPYGVLVEIEGGNVKDVRQAGCPVGTTFIVKDLFFNTPARYKFLKKNSTEAGHISDIITRIALGNPQISFKLISNNSTVIHTPGNNDILSTIFSLYGSDIAKKVNEVDYSDEKVKITGYVGRPEIARSNRNYQSIYINDRYIKCKTITAAIDDAYKTVLMKNKFPFVVLKLEINPLLVDVNVHPAKMEVRFSNSQEIFRSVYHAVINKVLDKNEIRDVKLHVDKNEASKIKQQEIPATKYEQQNLDIGRYFKEEPKCVRNKATREKFNFVFTEQAKPGKKEFFTTNEEDNNVYHNKDNKKHSSNLKEMISPAEKTISVEKVDNTVKYNAKRIDGLKEKEENNNSFLSEAKVIGQIFSTYIILQDGDDMVLIDQHAAHERIMFEKLKKRFNNNEKISQGLIAPVVIELTQQEIKFLEVKKEFINKIGFEFENFGNNSIILRAVPYTDKGDTVKEGFLEVIDNLMNTDDSDYNNITEETLYTIACKAAVKANKRLDEIEIRNVLHELGEIKNPFTCPHGRPTAIRIKKYEIEKKFKRIL